METVDINRKINERTEQYGSDIQQTYKEKLEKIKIKTKYIVCKLNNIIIHKTIQE